ncbi:MAG TPA: ABC transporter permease [Bryobacteraceae bacterium]|nr:ABC transporter permease [Bryobacteraceae bacterium]
MLESLLRDFGYGVRTLRRSPGFTAVAALTLALGIGATTAVFSLVNAVLLRALPYRDPAQLVFLWEPVPTIPDVPLEAWGPFNGDFFDWQRQSHSFACMALFTTDAMNLSTSGAAVRVRGSRVTADFFRVLGIGAELGRTPGLGDNGVVAISHALWQRQFGGDPHVLGRQLLLDAKPYRIVGVMPSGFAFPHDSESLETAGKSTDVWEAWAMTPQERASREDDPGTAIARLRPGVSREQAQAELSAITARLNSLPHPQGFTGATSVIRGFDETVTGASRRSLLIFLGAVGLVLLIACSNIGSLVLARANRRTGELSLRAALGASRGRLVRQLLAESVSLAALGGALGVVLAFAAVRLLVIAHPAYIPRLEETSIDARVLVFAIGATLATALLFGLFPALSASHTSLNETLKSASSRTTGAGAGRRWSPALMIAEVALSIVLLAGSGLLIRSFLKLESVNKGFRPAGAVTMNIQLDGRYNTPERQNAFFRDVLARARALPGVQTAAAINFLPLGGGESLNWVEIDGQKALFEGRAVTPRYFASMGIPLVRGRAFTDADTAGQPAVMIVSRRLAARFFPHQEALGRRFQNAIIVGIVGDVRQYNIEQTPPLQIYTPLWQTGANAVSVVVRTSDAPDLIAGEMRGLVRGLDPAVAVADVRTMSQLVSAATAQRRFQTFLLTTFGGIALFLSLLGLYALTAWWVAQRTAEIGIRMALGARRPVVLRLALKQGARPALAGIVLGFAGAAGLTRLMRSLLFDVAPIDPMTFGAVAVLFSAVALAACWVPAWRATRVDPVVALRYE